MKTIVLNASPRNNANTAQILKAAMEGAHFAGAQTETINLYNLNFTGCRSCLACKRKGVERCVCYWQDDLSPVIEKVYAADTLLIGTPIFFGRPTSQYFAFVERLRFPALSYNDYGNYFKGKINVGLFVTMNATKEFCEQAYREKLEAYANEFKMLNGEISLYPVYDTLQVNDYSDFEMGGVSEEKKKAVHEACFPKDLKNAYEIGAKLAGL